jgi:hypothetical protein
MLKLIFGLRVDKQALRTRVTGWASQTDVKSWMVGGVICTDTKAEVVPGTFVQKQRLALSVGHFS